VANTKSAEKAARQAAKHRERNVALRSKSRTAIRSVNEAIASGNKAEAEKAYRDAVGLVDSLVNKKLVHRNVASRHKSRLAAKVKKLK
jgi:small subunit ribosomal protein S20